MQAGIVFKSTGSWYQVRLADGTMVPCRIGGKFRQDDKRLTNPIAVGDQVMIEIADDEQKAGDIRKILPRKNYVVRQSPRRKHDLHLIASNIDQAMIVMTVVQPMLKQGFIDRFLLMTEPFNIPTTIVFNKVDLYEEKDIGTLAHLQDIYEEIGYTTLIVSATAGHGLEEMKAALKDKTTLISGQSGVGKSTLINAIAAGLALRTGDISDYTGKGQHTTTFAEMFPLSFGGFLIDTPGIKTLSFNYLEPADVAHNFREFFVASVNCRFGGNCLHRNEPGCAVKAGVEEGTLSELRYANYLGLLEEIEEQNYWERRKV
ncbi:MAG: ribosome small subunit-dependent GTPase A [Bacteroidetes bacterium]|nr:MAG: ribosome small subunit-dependent GTPase A [Bacteroidota bacterium]PTM08952.1 MAG: ribosome small subunit-dependent GTPase A [Bacteroidota bacterium]